MGLLLPDGANVPSGSGSEVLIGEEKKCQKERRLLGQTNNLIAEDYYINAEY